MRIILDKVISTLILILVAPVLLVVALLVRYKLGCPVFFVQERPGLNGAPFNLYKFRTMRSATDADGIDLPDEERVGKFGKMLMSTSVDELPTFYNVLIGDMTLIGPRPLLMEYLPLYSKNQWRRNLVKPGITGWSQVNGRNAISWDKKLELDVWYVDNQSLFLDIKIIFLTIKKVIFREDISASDHVTIKKFTGSNEN